MSRQVQIRRGTATEHESFTGKIGEITMDTTNNTIRVHDGITPGGTVLAKQNDIPSAPDMSEFADYAMPSNNYDDLILGVSDATYTAPGNGYFTWHKTTNGANQYFGMINLSSGMIMSVQWVPVNGGGCQGFLPARSGDVCRAIYTAGGHVDYFRFVYAVGSES